MINTQNTEEKTVQQQIDEVNTQGRAFSIAARFLTGVTKTSIFQEGFDKAGEPDMGPKIKEAIETKVVPCLTQTAQDLKELAQKGERMLNMDGNELLAEIAQLCNHVMGVDDSECDCGEGECKEQEKEAAAATSQGQTHQGRIDDREPRIAYLTPEEQEQVFKYQELFDACRIVKDGESTRFLAQQIMKINNRGVLRVMDARETPPEAWEEEITYCDLTGDTNALSPKNKDMTVVIDLTIGSPLYEDLLRLLRRHSEAHIILKDDDNANALPDPLRGEKGPEQETPAPTMTPEGAQDFIDRWFKTPEQKEQEKNDPFATFGDRWFGGKH